MSYKSLFCTLWSRFEDLYHNMKVRLFIEFILAESMTPHAYPQARVDSRRWGDKAITFQSSTFWVWLCVTKLPKGHSAVPKLNVRQKRNTASL
jgi:hypothetical protein